MLASMSTPRFPRTAAVVALLSLGLFRLSADGMVLPQLVEDAVAETEAVPVLEASQRALVFFDAAASHAGIVLTVDVLPTADVTDLLWLVPVFTTGTVGDIAAVAIDDPDALLDALADASPPSVRGVGHVFAELRSGPTSVPVGFGCSSGYSYQDDRYVEADGDPGQADATGGVTWITTDVATLEVTRYAPISGAALAADLAADGYGELSDEHVRLFQAYVERGAKFIQAEVADVTAEGTDPVSVAFAITYPADRAIFPMEISAPGLDRAMKLQLWVAAADAYAPVRYLSYADLATDYMLPYRGLLESLLASDGDTGEHRESPWSVEYPPDVVPWRGEETSFYDYRDASHGSVVERLSETEGLLPVAYEAWLRSRDSAVLEGVSTVSASDTGVVADTLYKLGWPRTDDLRLSRIARTYDAPSEMADVELLVADSDGGTLDDGALNLAFHYAVVDTTAVAVSQADEATRADFSFLLALAFPLGLQLRRRWKRS